MLDNDFLALDSTKAESIINDLRFIKKNLRNEDNLYIELLGTPKSGKTSLKTVFIELLETYSIKAFATQESAEYILLSDNLEFYDYWVFTERIVKILVNNVMSKKTITIIDRGIIDRLIWMELAKQSGELSNDDYTRLHKIVDDIISEYCHVYYSPITIGFYTSPEICIARKGYEGQWVNVPVLTKYNEILSQNECFIRDISYGYSLVNTDIYQKNIRQFYLDTIYLITNQLVDKIKDNRKSTVKRIKK